MAFQMGASPQSVHPRDSMIGHMNALSKQGSSVRQGASRAPDYHSLMLRDPRTPSDAPQQRGVTSPGAYNPLRSTRPAVPGEQGGAGDAQPGDDVAAATGNFGHVLGPTVQSAVLGTFGNMAKGTTTSTAKDLAMAVQQGLISPTQAAKLGPTLMAAQFANPTTTASMFGSALGTGLSAADAAAAGDSAVEAGATPSTADLTAMSNLHGSELGLTGLAQHSLDAISGLFGGSEADPTQAAHTANLSDNSPTDPTMSLSESQAALSTIQGQQSQNTAFLTHLLEQQGNMSPAQVAAALNASLGQQGVSTSADGGPDANSAGFGFGADIGDVAPGITQGDTTAHGMVDVTGTSPDMVAAMMAEAGVEAGVSTGDPGTDAAIDASLSAAFGDNEGSASIGDAPGGSTAGGAGTGSRAGESPVGFSTGTGTASIGDMTGDLGKGTPDSRGGDGGGGGGSK